MNQHHRTTRPAAPGEAPIYDTLVAELGDVQAEASRIAEQVQQDANRPVDFRAPCDPPR
ncbi:hypothetical protein [Streptomyces sediminimaris]|uniref:hypothetical protein n=1 Tax=Streptomyces sediminimaris TaxID=3383721 RepID=UPI003999837D